jgi:hypothetical protein
MKGKEIKEINGQTRFAHCCHVHDPDCEFDRLTQLTEIDPIRRCLFVSIRKLFFARFYPLLIFVFAFDPNRVR